MPIPLGILAVAGAGAGVASDFDLLETITTSGTTTASVSFSNLNNYSDYKHLQIRMVVRSMWVNNTDTLRAQVNGDTAENYSRHDLTGNGSTVSSNAQAPKEYFARPVFPGNTDTADAYAAIVYDILDFSNTSKNSTARALAGHTAANASRIALHSGVWRNTNAITSIALQPDTGANWASNCRFSLYGIK